MTKIKNKTYQPIPFLIKDKTRILPARKSMEVKEVTQQMMALKSQGLVQIIKK